MLAAMQTADAGKERGVVVPCYRSREIYSVKGEKERACFHVVYMTLMHNGTGSVEVHGRRVCITQPCRTRRNDAIAELHLVISIVHGVYNSHF
jgi:hypothetical protein